MSGYQGAPVTLGDVTLVGFEVPDIIGFGGQQQLTVHKLPGGARVIDAMGPDPRDLEFSGKILGPLAAPRARQIDAMRLAGAPVTLAWSDFSYTVVVSSFEADYTYGGYLIPYRCKCTVVPDPQPDAPPDLASQTVSDAQDLTSLPMVPSDAANAVAAVLLAIPPGTVFDPPGGAAFDAATAAVVSLAGVVGAGFAASDTAFGVLVPAAGGSLIPGSDALTAAIGLNAMAAAAQSEAMYAASSAYSSRMLANMISGA